ncbi:Mesaconyl-C(4)-CoA hydratase [Lachnellula subtilissima]|uniref:Mesaconyl-C(4)-CoA hydratase n=1 Tax=Lachnellula subtilissima TaxID=602034 RepID=A0A8H8UEW3_9HELO|nr:Mesaconyl-C(4)-CoA hydratase [Lachnellula subtilissima]
MSAAVQPSPRIHKLKASHGLHNPPSIQQHPHPHPHPLSLRTQHRLAIPRQSAIAAPIYTIPTPRRQPAAALISHPLPDSLAAGERHASASVLPSGILHARANRRGAGPRWHRHDLQSSASVYEAHVGGGRAGMAAPGKGGLRVGQRVTETTRLISAAGKKTRAGEEMVVVGVEKEYNNSEGVALIDRRNWIFRPEITTPQIPAARPAEVPLPSGLHTRDFTQTPVTLFRFSALTFNAHKIHYNREWCREVEGHRDLVVHGPLNLINIVDFWRDIRGGNATPKKITYRATSPLYAGERYRIVMDDEKDRITEAKIVDCYGNVGMVGRIESF